LAIGDGANDVNMITAAHVGVGIKGVEGQQAARASDFAIGEFKLLRRLVMVHGREAYRRNTKLICYNFYKNVFLCLPQLWFAFMCGFSATFIYDPLMYQFFNMFFTFLPIVIYALFDEEFPYSKLEKTPFLYFPGMRGINQLS
jgi:phospholipid-transporting ATPase